MIYFKHFPITLSGYILKINSIKITLKKEGYVKILVHRSLEKVVSNNMIVSIHKSWSWSTVTTGSSKLKTISKRVFLFFVVINSIAFRGIIEFFYQLLFRSISRR